MRQTAPNTNWYIFFFLINSEGIFFYFNYLQMLHSLS